MKAKGVVMEKSRTKRRKYMIDSRFQVSFAMKFFLIVVIASLVMGFFVILLTRDFTTVTIENTQVLVKRTQDFIFPVLLETFIIVNIFSTIAVLALALITSHRISGPLYRIKNEIELLKKGNLNANFRIRKKDELQDLANSLSELTNALRDKDSLLNEKVSQLKSVLRDSFDDKAAINAKIREIENILKRV